jgi:hypothetical protein
MKGFDMSDINYMTEVPYDIKPDEKSTNPRDQYFESIFLYNNSENEE